MVCHGKGQASILGPVDKVPQDENRTKRGHMAIAYSHVILVMLYHCWDLGLFCASNFLPDHQKLVHHLDVAVVEQIATVYSSRNGLLSCGSHGLVWLLLPPCKLALP